MTHLDFDKFAVKSGPLDWASIRGASPMLCLVGAYVVLVPTLSFIPFLGPYNEKRALQIGVLIAGAVGLLTSQSARQQWLSTFLGLPHVARWGLSGVLSLGILSSALAPAPFYAFLELSHFTLLFVAAGVIASEVRRAPTWTQQALLGVVAVSGALYAVYFGVGYVAHLTIADIKIWPNGGTNYANIRFFNHYQTWTLPLLTGLFLSLPRRWRVGKSLAFGLIVLWWALVFASNVRGTIVAMGVGAIGVGLLFRERAKSWLFVQAAGILLGLGAYYVLFSTGGAPPVTEKFGRGSPGRLQHWRACLEVILVHPILGIGPMHFAWLPPQFTGAASPHSALLQWLTEWGIPSTTVMIGLAIWGGWQWVEKERETTGSTVIGTSESMGVALVASALAGAAHAMVSGLIVTPLSQMLLVLVGGWAWGRYQHSISRSTEDFSIRSQALLSLLLIGSLLVVGSSLQDLTTTEERHSEFLEATDWSQNFRPRYWTQGYIGIQDERHPYPLE